jgi:hypothetical protein
MSYQYNSGKWRIAQEGNTPSELYEQHGDDDETVMYLVRSNHQAAAIAESLSKEGIPFASQSVEDWHESGLIDIYNALCHCREIPQDASYTYQKGFVFDITNNLQIDTEELTELIGGNVFRVY